ncbi:unnamed protein product [Closterium sp. NIES-53]
METFLWRMNSPIVLDVYRRTKHIFPAHTWLLPIRAKLGATRLVVAPPVNSMAAPSSLLRAGFRSARDALNRGDRCRIPVSASQFQAAGNFFPRTLQQLQQPSECAEFSTESGSAAAGEAALPAQDSGTMPPSFDARAADAAVAAAAASSGSATTDAASSGAAAVTSGADGSRAVLAKLLNVPRMVLKEELLRSFRNPALTPADVFTVLDDRLHTLHWYGAVRCGAVCYGAVQCGVVWCGLVWCGAAVWCGGVRHGGV